jgi:hypothetical protein
MKRRTKRRKMRSRKKNSDSPLSLEVVVARDDYDYEEIRLVEENRPKS